MFKKLEYSLDLVAEPFDNLKYRDRTTLILLKDNENKFILGTKAGYYPDGIVRMIGGGVDKGESELDGAIREVQEEIGISASPKELVELVEVAVSGKYQSKTYKTRIFVYFFNSDKDDYLAGDDVTDILRYTRAEYEELVKRLFEIKSGPWADFGQVYGYVHQVTLEEYDSKLPLL